MRRCILFVAIIFAMVVPGVSAQGVKQKVAVYMTGDVEETYKKVMGAKLVSAITATKGYAAVERTADFLAALSSEQDYQMSGEVRDSQIARLGQRFGVKYVVVADISEIFDELFVTSRLINVETGLVEAAFDENSPAESLDQLITLSTKVANGLLFGALYEISEEPRHMSLCASKDGKIIYITQDSWELMSEREQNTYEKRGVCVIDDGTTYIVSMKNGRNNRFGGTDLIRLSILPKYKDSLDKAFVIFGGDTLSFPYLAYYTKSEWVIDRMWYYYKFIHSDGNTSSDVYFDNDYEYNIRKIYILNEL